jgi:hypothetical protein
MSLLPVGIGSSGSYEIAKSLRFRASSSADLSRTPGSASNRKTWTWSGWVKRGIIGAAQRIFSAGTFNDFTEIGFVSTDAILIRNEIAGAPTSWRATSAVYRDPSAHYHIIVAVDTTQAVAADRVKLYVNGEEVISFSTSNNPTLNYDTFVNNNVLHYIGKTPDTGGPFPIDGYLSEINFIDGQALTPSSFGETDPVTGVWVPKKYTGTYGTNGFYLPFSNGTSLTTLTADASGNGNNWTANNISLTAGATYDWMDDTPTNNFAVLNPLVNSAGFLSYAEANSYVAVGAADKLAYGTFRIPESGKWYFEYTASVVGAATVFGLESGNAQQSSGAGFSGANARWTQFAGAASNGDVLMAAVDRASGFVWLGRNGTWLSGDPVAGTSPSHTGLGADPWFPVVYINSANGRFNFGQRPFAYTPPTGFLPLCTKNLTNTTVTTSGSFTGNASANGPFVWLNGVPTAMTINGNAVTFATHADRTAGGFKIRTSSSSYDVSGTNNYTITTTGAAFKDARAQVNP